MKRHTPQSSISSGDIPGQTKGDASFRKGFRTRLIETCHWALADGRRVVEKKGAWFVILQREDGVRRFELIPEPNLDGAVTCDPPPRLEKPLHEVTGVVGRRELERLGVPALDEESDAIVPEEEEVDFTA